MSLLVTFVTFGDARLGRELLGEAARRMQIKLNMLRGIYPARRALAFGRITREMRPFGVGLWFKLAGLRSGRINGGNAR